MDKYPHNDLIKEILKDKPELVQQHGLNYLIPIWQRFADQYADSEELIYEWLNDLDARKIIDEILDILPEAEQQRITQELKPIDDIFLSKTFEVKECVWGEEAERKNHYNRQRHWYYYRVNEHIFDKEVDSFTKRH